jgi:dCMP deaminase
MASKQETDRLYMQIAESYAGISKAIRKRVGACLVTSQGSILGGTNGTARGSDNACERVLTNGELETLPETIHAELNCVLRAAREGVSILGSTVYVTLSCCKPCAAMLIQAGVKRVVYKEDYRCKDGVQYLQDNNVLVEQLT